MALSKEIKIIKWRQLSKFVTFTLRVLVLNHILPVIKFLYFVRVIRIEKLRPLTFATAVIVMNIADPTHLKNLNRNDK